MTPADLLNFLCVLVAFAGFVSVVVLIVWLNRDPPEDWQ